MKKLSLLLCILGLLAVVVLAACNGTPGDPDDSSTAPTVETTEAEIESVTESQTQANEESETVEESTEETTAEESTTQVQIPEGMEGATVSFTTFAADGEAFRAAVTPNVDFEGVLILTFKYGGNSKTFTYDLNVPKDGNYEITGEGISFLKSNYTIDVAAVVEDYVADQYTLTFKRGVIQLNERSIDLVVDHLPLREKASLVLGWPVENVMAARTHGNIDYNIRSIKLADGPGGLRTVGPTVSYPVGMNLASTWNRELIQTVAASLGDDCVQYGVGVILGPGMNIHKNVLCGRNFEYYSEDPFLTGMMAAHYTKGVQSQGVGVALKHFAANNQETDRWIVSSNVTERALREIYLRGFEYAVKMGNPYTVMSSYNRINGIPTAANRDLLQTILRDEFGFGGMVMSDWGANGGRVGMLQAGNDMACGYNSAAELEIILNCVANGELDEELLDIACKRVLALVVKTNASSDRNASNEIANRDEKDALVRQAGAESLVLLKNEDATLPMKGGEIALFAANSYNLAYCGGGSGSVTGHEVVQLPTAIQATAGFSVNETVAELYKNFEQYRITPEIAAQAAREADYAIFTVTRLSVEGNDHKVEKGDFLLSDIERTVLENVSDAFRNEGKPVIVLLNVANPIEVASWQDLVDAIVLVGFTGEEIGNSIMDVLSGRVNPSAKLVDTWPISYDDAPDKKYFGALGTTLYYEDVYVGYRYYTTFGVDVAYPFGYGLSYTSYEYSDFTLDGEDGEYRLSVTVKNTGNVAGREIVQFYVTKPDGVNQHPVIELVGFDKTVLLAPGESQTVTVTVTLDELKTYYTDESDWLVERGEYTFHVGASVEDIKDTASVTIDREILVLDAVNACQPQQELDVLTKN